MKSPWLHWIVGGFSDNNMLTALFLFLVIKMHSRWDTISRKHFHFSLPDTALAIPLVCATLPLCGESGVTFGVLASTLLVAAPHSSPIQDSDQIGATDQIFKSKRELDFQIFIYPRICIFDLVAYERTGYRSYIRDPRKICIERRSNEQLIMKNSFWGRNTNSCDTISCSRCTCSYSEL